MSLVASFGLLLGLQACAGDPIFTPIGSHLSAPIAITLDAARSRAYVVNSNFNLAFSDSSVLVLDLSTPTAPSILEVSGNPISIPDLSGEAYLDTADQHLFITNRFSDNDNDIVDQLLRIDVNEAGDFGGQQQVDAGENPFGLVCCDTNDRLYVIAEGALKVFARTDLSDMLSRSLQVALENGSLLRGESTTRGTIVGNQLFLTNRAGVLYVLNTDKMLNAELNPIDYLISGFGDARGIASDGTNLYVADTSLTHFDDTTLRVLDLSTLPAISENSETVTELELSAIRTVVIDENNSEDRPIEKTNFSLEDNPQEVLYYAPTQRVYVSNQDSDSISVFDVSNPDAVIADINHPTIALTLGDQTGGAPFGLAAAELGGTDLLYVTTLDTDRIFIINLETHEVAGVYP